MQLLKINNISFKYENRYVLENINLDIKSGEYICLIGSNGSGKSTLLKIILGLLSPYNGEIIKNIDLSKIAYVPQLNLSDRNFPATAKEIILSGTQKKSYKNTIFYTKENKIAANKAIEIMKIENLMNKRLANMSGGQQQRVFLARAIAREAQLLILDEPCSGLDSEITAEIYTLLSDYNKKNGISILTATHDFTQVEKYATKIIEMDN